MQIETAKEIRPSTTRTVCYGSVGVGVILAAIALSAMLVDLSNNHSFGAKYSAELGVAMALAAIGLTALPAAAVMLGRWCWRLRTGTALAVFLTIVAAISAYTEKQGTEILARQGAADTYQTAQANATAARKEILAAVVEADRIAETATVADLETVARRERELAQLEASKDRGGRGNRARSHEDAETAALARIPSARAKEAALARAAAARARLDATGSAIKSGPAEVSMLATVLAGRLDRMPADVARDIALITTVASIAVTLILALLAEQATRLIIQGLGIQAIRQPRAELAKTDVPISLAVHDFQREKLDEKLDNLANGNHFRDVTKMVLPIAKNETQAPLSIASKPQEPVKAAPKPRKLPELTPEQRMKKFARECFNGTGEATGGEVYEAFEAWWISHAPGQKIPSQIALSKVLAENGIEKVRRGGKTRYMAGLVSMSIN